MGIVKFGEDIIVTGENLWTVSRAGDPVQDGITINYLLGRTVGEIIRADLERLDPAKSR